MRARERERVKERKEEIKKERKERKKKERTKDSKREREREIIKQQTLNYMHTVGASRFCIAFPASAPHSRVGNHGPFQHR